MMMKKVPRAFVGNHFSNGSFTMETTSPGTLKNGKYHKFLRLQKAEVLHIILSKELYKYGGLRFKSSVPINFSVYIFIERVSYFSSIPKNML